jgi:hypothetical protein
MPLTAFCKCRKETLKTPAVSMLEQVETFISAKPTMTSFPMHIIRRNPIPSFSKEVKAALTR